MPRVAFSKRHYVAFLLLACSSISSNGVFARRIAPSGEVDSSPVDDETKTLGYNPLASVEVAEDHEEEIAAEIEARTHEEQAKIESRIQAERADADAASHARDLAEMKLTSDDTMLETSKKAVDDARALVEESGMDKKVAIAIMERREAELTRLREEAAAASRKTEELKAKFEEAQSGYNIALQHHHDRVTLSNEMKAQVVQMESELVIHKSQRKGQFQEQKLQIQTQVDERVSQNEDEADARIARIREEVDKLAATALEQEKAAVADEDKTLQPILSGYRTSIKSLEEDFQKSMEDLNKERTRLLQQKMADMQRYKLTPDKIKEIQDLSSERLNTLNEQIRIKTENVHNEKNSAFDAYLSRKNEIRQRFSDQSTQDKRNALDRLEAKMKEIDQIKAELAIKNSIVEKDGTNRVNEGEQQMLNGSQSEQKAVDQLFAKATEAVQAVDSHLPDVDKSHADMIEAERQYSESKMHSLQARLAAKKNEVEEARQHVALASESERAHTIEVRHAEARVRELEDMVKRDQKLIQKYESAVRDHESAADALGETPVPSIVEKQVKNEWSKKKQAAEYAIRAALRGAGKLAVQH